MYINQKTRRALERAIGKSTAEIAIMDAEEERVFVKAKVGMKPHYSKLVDARMRGRGNPLIARRRLCTMEDIDKRIMKLR